MEKITVLCTVDFSEEHLEKLRAVSSRLDVRQIRHATSMDDIPEALRRQAEVLYGYSQPVRQGHRFSKLKWIQTHSAGIDYLIDKPVWHSPVLITNLSGVHAVTMAEHVLAMMLAFRWNLPRMERFKSRKKWPEERWNLFARPELRGCTLGVIGYGAIGREIARQGQALGMKIVAASRSGERHPQRGFNEPGIGDPEGDIPARLYAATDLLEMLPQCDYVVTTAPLTQETRHLMNATAFTRMKSSAFFFNLGRGAVVDESALIDALQQGQIAGAGLDVFEEEPLPPDSPLWEMEQVIISPHVAGLTLRYDDRATDLFAENLRRYVNGEPLLNIVDREKGY